MSRFSTTTRGVRNKSIGVCILASTPIFREKMVGPRVLRYIGQNRVIDLQIQAIKNAYHFAEITITVGFGAEKIIKNRPHELRILENQLYETTSSGEDIRLYLNNNNFERVIIIENDTLISQESIINTVEYGNLPFVDNQTNDIGLIIDNGICTRLSYNNNNSWGNFVYLEGKDLLKLRKLATKEISNITFHEVINKLIDSRADLKVVKIK